MLVEKRYTNVCFFTVQKRRKNNLGKEMRELEEKGKVCSYLLFQSLMDEVQRIVFFYYTTHCILIQILR